MIKKATVVLTAIIIIFLGYNMYSQNKEIKFYEDNAASSFKSLLLILHDTEYKLNELLEEPNMIKRDELQSVSDRLYGIFSVSHNTTHAIRIAFNEETERYYNSLDSIFRNLADASANYQVNDGQLSEEDKERLIEAQKHLKLVNYHFPYQNNITAEYLSNGFDGFNKEKELN
ncbi:hypothetical protein [Desertibacillus haloalkaliphilus]|uniref:hypothetical protein n=1 Tax=Desertibacillus haloalkaliphilus TaxID=1328930 RepID=UPI001C25E3C1|nr:hypothetical protein [Desertibacillus haloalkaliphilus]MBU8907477.1 hypothetical protein [Desertibacillus haloalkaliphilus]